MKPYCDTFIGKLSPACIIQKKQVQKGNIPSFAQPQPAASSQATAPGFFSKNAILLIGGAAAIGILFYVLRKK